MISLDATSLFTNIPTKLVINSLKKRCYLIKKHTNFKQKDFLQLVEFLLNNTFFKFDNQFYQQVIASPMGSTISPILANSVMEDMEIEVRNNIFCNSQQK